MYFWIVIHMRKVQYYILITALLGIAGLAACDKYKDPPPTDLGLTRKYCNDPIAANYNDSFPGIPDNSVCIYPNELFKGTWLFRDSVYLPDMTFFQAQDYTLTFLPGNPALDTLKNKVTVSGFCSNGNTLALTTTRFGLAMTDTLVTYTQGGQLFCTPTDTVSGMFRLIFEATGNRIQIQMNEQAPGGSYIHTGYATKQ